MQRKSIDRGRKNQTWGDPFMETHNETTHFPNQPLVLRSPFSLAGKDTNTISSKEQYMLNKIICNPLWDSYWHNYSEHAEKHCTHERPLSTTFWLEATAQPGVAQVIISWLLDTAMLQNRSLHWNWSRLIHLKHLTKIFVWHTYPLVNGLIKKIYAMFTLK